MGNFIDISGRVFGKLTVISVDGSKPAKHIQWMCKCACGATTSARGNHLRDGMTRSCGCGMRMGKAAIQSSDGIAKRARAVCACGSEKDSRAIMCKACRMADKSEKLCPGCSTVKPIGEFYRRSAGQIIPRCKACVAIIGRSNPEQRAEIHARSNAKRWKKTAARIKARIARDPQFKMAVVLRAGVRQAIHRYGEKKAGKTLELIGCTIGEFMRHIEAQWTHGMSWANWGRTRHCWQLDHIEPVRSFDLSDPAQQRACFHFTNYQPLWQLENCSKGARPAGRKFVIELQH